MDPNVEPVQCLLLEADRLRDGMALSSVSVLRAALASLLRSAEDGGEAADVPKKPEIVEALGELIDAGNDAEVVRTSVKLLRIAMRPRVEQASEEEEEEEDEPTELAEPSSPESTQKVRQKPALGSSTPSGKGAALQANSGSFKNAGAPKGKPTMSRPPPDAAKQLKLLVAEGRSRPHLLLLKRDADIQSLFAGRCEGHKKLALLMVSADTDDELMRDACELVADAVAGNDSAEEAALKAGVLEALFGILARPGGPGLAPRPPDEPPLRHEGGAALALRCLAEFRSAAAAKALVPSPYRPTTLPCPPGIPLPRRRGRALSGAGGARGPRSSSGAAALAGGGYAGGGAAGAIERGAARGAAGRRRDAGARAGRGRGAAHKGPARACVPRGARLRGRDPPLHCDGPGAATPTPTLGDAL
jgi:hypothetical protein